MKLKRCLQWILMIVTAAGLMACGKKNSGEVAFTRLKPPVQDAAGSQLTSDSPARSSSSLVASSFASSAVKDRFFSGGPTDILRILGDVDSRLADIESRAKDGDHACLDATAIPIQLPLFGVAVDFAFQCYSSLSGPNGANGVLMFGKEGSTWSVYAMIGAGPVAAKATDLGGGKTAVEIWGGVGYGNSPSWDAGSYTGFHLKANDRTKSLEITAGGIGIGFCGVTVKSDGTNLYTYGSADGMGGACDAIASTCVLTSDLATAGNCSAIDENHFELTGLGRTPATGSNSGNIPANWSASAYPANAPTLFLDGSGVDMLHFGVSSVADVPFGVGAF